ncbi:uncharacterized protein PGTG_19879 [Puccinia graminis f. sp. tritici CRL 75-36-700-3]|uniref:Uncharacterized protein n=1 Tax=Puccinia graminis f. sp. tritici (strain CRL 75-36-700-3 / race SCCL) TaxID=418459 RepID=E3LBM4_PUCGT|nr:uncharacterized protein PGTG_19879 [Puccinia graminis f. sp. tritici CRL 75-36-700-3]EFP93949.1 hypothetical protein PGTG_19879 [Puccinia graminis f. sp. tritici CRL 75-36-700-3]
MAKSHKRSHSNYRPALTILLQPMRFFVMSLVKILALLLAHPGQTCTFLVVILAAVYFFNMVDSLVAFVLPFKPFRLLYSHIKSSSKNILDGLCGVVYPHRSSNAIPRLLKNTKDPLQLTTSVLVLLNEPGNFFAETTDLLELSNSLLFMNMKLGNHTKISSQVRNLANMYSLFTDEIEKLDSAGIRVLEIISQEYYKVIYQNKHPKNQVGESLVKLSNDEVENLQANINKTLELAFNLLNEQDKTSILFHEETSFLQNVRNRRGLWGFKKRGDKKVEAEETLIYLNHHRENLKRSWTTLEKQRRQLILFLDKIQNMKASFSLIRIHNFIW